MDSSASSFSLVQQLSSSLTPDCAKFCRIPGFQDILVIASYELLDSKIYGALQLFKLKEGSIVETHYFETPGVLDFQWFPQAVEGAAYLCTACSDSFVRVYLFDEASQQLQQVAAIATEELHKCLYVDVRVTDSTSVEVVTSTDQESVFKFQLSRVSRTEFILAEPLLKAQKHQFSVWACALSPSDTNIFLSGGDDQKLILYDSRVPDLHVQTNRRSHEMGITTINFNPHNDQTFFTGCYDEHLRLWDMRNLSREVFASKREGGVWRAVWKPTDSSQALIGVYCQKYFEIVDVSKAGVEQKEQLQGAHNSLAYSCDWSSDTRHIITASFYDKVIQLWQQK